MSKDDKADIENMTLQDLLNSENLDEKDKYKDSDEQPEIPSRLPVLPVRDLVIFNYTILPLFVGREPSLHAVEAALQGNRYLLVLSQKKEEVEDPTAEDLYEVGTVVMIMRMLKLPDGRLKLLVQESDLLCVVFPWGQCRSGGLGYRPF